MSKTDKSHAESALEHLAVLRVHSATEGVVEDLRFDAICMRLAAAIEDASRMSDEARAGAFGELWPAMWATRNRITHGYAFVSPEVIAATVERDIDGFEAGLVSIVKAAADPHHAAPRDTSGPLPSSP